MLRAHLKSFSALERLYQEPDLPPFVDAELARAPVTLTEVTEVVSRDRLFKEDFKVRRHRQLSRRFLEAKKHIEYQMRSNQLAMWVQLESKTQLAAELARRLENTGTLGAVFLRKRALRKQITAVQTERLKLRQQMNDILTRDDRFHPIEVAVLSHKPEFGEAVTSYLSRVLNKALEIQNHRTPKIGADRLLFGYLKANRDLWRTTFVELAHARPEQLDDLRTLASTRILLEKTRAVEALETELNRQIAAQKRGTLALAQFEQVSKREIDALESSRFNTRLLATGLAIGLGIVIVGYENHLSTTESKHRREIERSRDRITTLENQRRDTDSKLNHALESLKLLEQQKASLEGEYTELKRTRDKLNDQIGVETKRAEDLAKNLELQEQDLVLRRQQVENLTRSLERRTGMSAPLKELLERMKEGPPPLSLAREAAFETFLTELNERRVKDGASILERSQAQELMQSMVNEAPKDDPWKLKQHFEDKAKARSRSKEIIYNFEKDNPFDLMIEGRTQCVGSTKLYQLARAGIPGAGDDTGSVVILTEGHALSGVVRNGQLLGVEHTVSGRGETVFGPTSTLHQIGEPVLVMHAGDFLAMEALAPYLSLDEISSFRNSALERAAKRFRIELKPILAAAAKSKNGNAGGNCVSGFGHASPPAGDRPRMEFDRIAFNDKVEGVPDTRRSQSEPPLNLRAKINGRDGDPVPKYKDPREDVLKLQAQIDTFFNGISPEEIQAVHKISLPVPISVLKPQQREMISNALTTLKQSFVEESRIELPLDPEGHEILAWESDIVFVSGTGIEISKGQIKIGMDLAIDRDFFKNTRWTRDQSGVLKPSEYQKR